MSESPRNAASRARLGPERSPERAPDLTDAERPVAAWFSSLERVDAPAELRARILTGAPMEAVGAGSVERAAPESKGRLLRMFPLGAWGVATAALVLVALGGALAVELVDPIGPLSGRLSGEARSASQQLGGNGSGQPLADSLVIVEDPTMALFHDLETFDEVGLAPGELIADWHR